MKVSYLGLMFTVLMILQSNISKNIVPKSDTEVKCMSDFVKSINHDKENDEVCTFTAEDVEKAIRA